MVGYADLGHTAGCCLVWVSDSCAAGGGYMKPRLSAVLGAQRGQAGFMFESSREKTRPYPYIAEVFSEMFLFMVGIWLFNEMQTYLSFVRSL